MMNEEKSLDSLNTLRNKKKKVRKEKKSKEAPDIYSDISSDNEFVNDAGFVSRKDSLKKKNLIKKSLDDWIPVKDIKYGIIYKKNNEYVKILEIAPVNFFHKPVNEQNSILDSFMSWLRICPKDFTFKCVSTKSNPDSHIKNVLRKTRDVNNNGMLECRDNYIDHIKLNSSSSTVNKRFFFIYRYTKQNMMEEPTIEDIYKQFEDIRFRFTKSFSMMGNSVIEPENDTLFQAEILHTLLNRNPDTDESVTDRINRIYSDTADVNDLDEIPEEMNIPVTRLISQKGMYLLDPEYMISDGLYYSFLYVEKDSFPVGAQYGGWTKIFTNFGEGIDADFYFHKRERQDILQDVKRHLKWKHVNANEKAGKIEEIDEITDNMNSTKYILDCMKQSHDDLFDISILITVTATTKEKLFEKINTVINDLKEEEIKAVIPYKKMEEAFIMSLPIMMPSKYIVEKSKHNFPTTSAASTYMLASSELFDETGIVAGKNGDGSLMAFNPFNTRMFKNANMILLGTSGSGKSFTEQFFTRRLRYMGIQVIGILPLKAHEYRRGLKHMGGTFVRLVPSSKDCVNIMEIRPADTLDETLIEGEEYEQESLLNKKIKQVTTFIQLLMKKEYMSNIEQTMLDEHLTALYNSFGINEDNDSIFDDVYTKKLKTMPIIQDLYENIENVPELKRVKTILRPFIYGTCKNMNGQTNVDLNNDLIMFDVEAAGKDLLPAFMFIALDFAYDVIKSNRTKNNVILLDEVWKMMLNPMAAEFVLELTKIVRGYGGGTMIGTQDLNDFLGYQDGKYGKGILASSKIKIIMQLEEDEVDRVKDVFKLTEDERKNITKFERGTGLFMANNDKIYISFDASQMEKDDFTTDPNELRRIRDRKAAIQNKSV